MKKGYLSEYFLGAAYKRLTTVETDRSCSNQHEFNGVSELKEIFGDKKNTFDAQFIYLCDDDPEPIEEEGFLTWYDAREAHRTRSEYRLYFSDSMVSKNASEGDILLIALQPDNKVLVIIAESDSTIGNQLLWLFGLNDSSHPGFSVRGELASDQIKLEFASNYILEQIGIEPEVTDDNYLEKMLTQFQGKFPSTKIFSEFARSTIPEFNVCDNPDDVINAWIQREYVLFATLERYFIANKLQDGFDGDVVEAFLRFSLSVQNRRKSRAGSSLENHLEYLFESHNIKYARNSLTEAKSRPDFLFPGNSEYHNPDYPNLSLTMLGVKSTCKDRWRQILTEANRIENKHLFTLEPSISENQTNEMKSKKVQLVLPKSLHASYTTAQQKWLMNMQDFIKMVKNKQNVESFS
jgi:hypothetical protein